MAKHLNGRLRIFGKTCLLSCSLASAGVPGSLAAQIPVGTVRELGSDGRLSIDLLSESNVRRGIVAYVVSFDDETTAYLPKAEIAIEAIRGAIADARVLSRGDDAAIATGDTVAVYGSTQTAGVTLRITPPQAQLLPGESAELEAELLDETGQPLQLLSARWRSSDPAVVQVNDLGRLVAIQPGSATISATTSGGLFAGSTIYVIEPAFLVPDSMTTFVGTVDTVSIRITANPARVLPASAFVWTSDNAAVATVDGSGVVSAVAPGRAEINARGYGRQISFPVRVYPRPVEVAFTPSASELVLTRGDRLEISSAVRLPDGQWLRQAVRRFAIADPSFFTSDSAGLRAAAEGETTIQALVAGFAQNWKVQIRKPQLRINTGRRVWLLDHSIALRAQYVRQNEELVGESLGVLWASSAPAVVRISGDVALAVAPGAVTIHAAEGTLEDSTTVYVLGDLLVTLDFGKGPEIYTASIARQEVFGFGGAGVSGWSPSLAPDGHAIAFVSKQDNGFPRLHVMKPDGTQIRRVTPDVRGPLGLPDPFYQEHSPTWSHDSQRLLFMSNRPGNYELFSIRPDGTQLRRLTFDGALDRNPSAAPNTPVLAFERARGSDRSEVLIAPSDGGAVLDPTTLTAKDVSQSQPAIFPDGSEMVVLHSGQRVEPRLVVTSVLKGSPARELVTLQGGHEIIYALAPDGSRLAYHQRPRRGAGGDRVVIIDVLDGSTVATLSVGSGAKILDMTWAAIAPSSDKVSP